MSDRLRPSTRLPAVAADLLRELRRTPPLTHCITNSVVTGFTANVLLAVGASPAMVDIVGEAEMFAGVASGLLVNIGTPDTEQRAATIEAVRGAHSAGTPWVLDPVAIGTLPVRTALAAELVAQRPTAVRGNPSEILALAGVGAGGRGVDAVDDPDAALEAARSIAVEQASVVAVSGAVDLITDGERVVRISNGDPLLTRVTGGGCALGGIMAAFLGVARSTEANALESVAAASLVYTLAAERAAAGSAGPGSFAVALLDALAALEPLDVERHARVEEGQL